MTGPRDSRRTWLILGAIAAVAALLRGWGLDRALSQLEINTWWYGQMPLGFLTGRSPYPPHIYVLAHLARPLLGDGEAWFRLPFAAYGVLAVPLVYLLGRRLFDQGTGLAAALLTAVSVCLIGHSQQARYYSLLAFYPLAGLYCLLRGIDSRGRRAALWWGGFVLAHALGASVHVFALYPFALCVLMLAAAALERGARGDRAGAREALGMGGAAAAAALLLILGLGGDLRFLLFHHLSSGQTLLETTADRTQHAGNIFRQLLVESGGGPALSGFLLAAGAAGVWLRRAAGARAYACLGLWLLLPPLSLAVVRSHYHFEPWYFVFQVPILMVWAASGFAAAASRIGGADPSRRAAAWALLLGAALALTAAPLRRHYSWAGEPWRDAVGAINRGCRAGDAVFFHPGWGRDGVTRHYELEPECRLYDPTYLTAQAGAAAPEVFARHPRVWTVFARTSAAREREEAGRATDLLERYYDLETRAELEGAQVSCYRRNRTALPAPAARPPGPARFSHGGPLQVHFLGNLAEAPALPLRPGVSVEELRLGPGQGWTGAGPTALLFCRSGSARLREAGRESRLNPGDLFRPDDGAPFGLRAEGSGAVVVRVGARREAAPWALLRRLGAGSWSLRPPGTAWPERTLAVVLEGRLRLMGLPPAEERALYLRQGDVFVGGRRAWPPSLYQSAGPEDLLLLLVGTPDPK